MTDTLPNGPYLYRVDDSRPPIVVEVFSGHVFECGEGGCRPLEGYNGKFTQLIEVAEAATVEAAKGASECDAAANY